MAPRLGFRPAGPDAPEGAGRAGQGTARAGAKSGSRAKDARRGAPRQNLRVKRFRPPLRPRRYPDPASGREASRGACPRSGCRAVRLAPDRHALCGVMRFAFTAMQNRLCLARNSAGFPGGDRPPASGPPRGVPEPGIPRSGESPPGSGGGGGPPSTAPGLGDSAERKCLVAGAKEGYRDIISLTRAQDRPCRSLNADGPCPQ
jgi:hypothetical protein